MHVCIFTVNIGIVVRGLLLAVSCYGLRLGFRVSLGLIKVNLGLGRLWYFRVSIKPEFVKVIYVATSPLNYRYYGNS